MITEIGPLEGLEMELTTIDSLSQALPPLVPLEEMRLTKKLESEGCEETVKVFILDGKYVIIDGHNRYRICRRLRIPFKVEVLPVKTLEEAKEWLLENQLARRNVADFVKCEYALARRDALIEEGRRRQGWRKKRDVSSNLMKREEKVDTQKQLAQIAGVSVGTIVTAKWLMENAAERTKEDLRKGKITIHMAYSETRNLLKADDEEIRRRVFNGELTIQKIVEDRKKEAKRKRDLEDAANVRNNEYTEGGMEDDVDEEVDLSDGEMMDDDQLEWHELEVSPSQGETVIPHHDRRARPVFPGYGLVSEPEPTPDDVRLPAPALNYDGTPMKSYGGAPEDDLEYRGAAEFQYVRSETRRILGYFIDRMAGIISDISPTTATESNLTELMSMLDEGFTTLRNKIMEVMNNG